MFGRIVECRIQCVEVTAVQMILNVSQGFTETLEVDDLPFAQETDRITDFGIFYDAENIVISAPGFLFCSQVFEKVGDRITFGLELSGTERYAACGLWPDSCGVVDVIWSKTGFFDFFRSQIPGKLVNDGGHDFQMG